MLARFRTSSLALFFGTFISMAAVAGIPATAAVVVAPHAKSALTIDSITTSDAEAFQILGSIGIADFGNMSLPGSDSSMTFSASVDGNFVGAAADIGFHGLTNGNVFSMGAGDALSMDNSADVFAHGPVGLADAFLFLDGVMSITNFSSTAVLSVELTWTAIVKALMTSTLPPLEDGFGFADVSFQAAAIAPGSSVAPPRQPVFNPMTASVDLGFGPMFDSDRGEVTFRVDVDPGWTQVLYLTADTSASAASLAVPLPAPLLSLISGLVAMLAFARRRQTKSRRSVLAT